MRKLFAAALAFLPGGALACPACARDSGPFTFYFIGAMIALPFTVAAVAGAVLWRSGNREDES